MSKKEKCSNTQKNRIVIHKDDKEKRIYRGQLDLYLLEGWIQGQSDKHKASQSDSHKDMKSPNKGKKCSEETKLKISNTLKNHIPWNKGIKKIIVPDDIKQNIISDYINLKLNLYKLSQKYNYKQNVIYTLLKENNVMKSPSEAKLGHEVSDITKQKISNKNKNHFVSEKTRKAVSNSNKKRTKEQFQIQVSKSYLTKKKNNTFNTSQPEKDLYEVLLKENVNKTILKQYKEERYPYYCDFYIKEDDLFIELNAHWTHGRHPFDKNNPEDIKKLNEWKEKAKTSKFYQQAIYVWTELDVKKQKCAKDNNLNYKTIY